jgi:DNA-binding NarL/FixJ family response regulator
MTIRVLVVDDEELVRIGFAMILEGKEDIRVVGQADDGRSAVEAVMRLQPDVVLMDIRMPHMDGLAATREILANATRPVRVVVLTTFDIDQYVYEALKAGASAFLLKDSPPQQLLAAIRVVAAGDALLQPSITRRLIEEFVKRPAPLTGPPPELAGLTGRELEVVKLAAKGLSNAEIGRELFLGETTVKSHLRHILRKLSLRDRVQLVVKAYELGLVQPGAG